MGFFHRCTILLNYLETISLVTITDRFFIISDVVFFTTELS